MGHLPFAASHTAPARCAMCAWHSCSSSSDFLQFHSGTGTRLLFPESPVREHSHAGCLVAWGPVLRRGRTYDRCFEPGGGAPLPCPSTLGLKSARDLCLGQK